MPKPTVYSRERMARALELRKAGDTYQTIAEKLDYGSISAAEKAVKSGLKLIVREPAEEVRTLELERLDVILRAQWPAVKRGDVRAAEVALRAMERRAGYLGLDAPKDINFGIDPTAIIRLVGVDPGDI